MHHKILRIDITYQKKINKKIKTVLSTFLGKLKRQLSSMEVMLCKLQSENPGTRVLRGEMKVKNYVNRIKSERKRTVDKGRLK